MVSVFSKETSKNHVTDITVFSKETSMKMPRSFGLIFGAVVRSGAFIRPAGIGSFFNRSVAPQTPPIQIVQRGLRSGIPLCTSVQDKANVDVDLSKSKVIVSRVMGSNDTQMYGMVHGGVVMQLIEEAGTILTMQYCNTNGNSPNDDSKVPRVITVSGCMERTDFLQPMFLGEVAEVHAEIGYTSDHSIQVVAEVYAKNVAKGEQRLTSQAKIWYVPMINGKEKKLMTVPPRIYDDPLVEATGKETYLRLKRLRDEVIRPRLNQPPWRPEDIKPVPRGEERHTANYSRAVTRHAVHPSSCWEGEKYLRGGVAMKWMDDAGSLTSSLHSAYPGFTISVDTIMFLRKIHLGAMMVITSKPVFVSQRTMEVLITGDELTLRSGEGIFLQRAVEAIFTFVAPDGKGKPRELPPLKLKTEEEYCLFEERKKLYEERQMKVKARKQ